MFEGGNIPQEMSYTGMDTVALRHADSTRRTSQSPNKMQRPM